MQAQSQTQHEPAAAHPVLLYDGVCGVCNRFVRFVLERDPEGLFRFAPLQSEFARALLERHGVPLDAGAPEDVPEELAFETVYVVREDPALPAGERVLERSSASLFVLSQLRGPWRLLGALRFVPRPLRDLGYRLVARYRYRLFGKSDRCELPRPGWAERFIATE